jgi:hypothetical protein
VTLSATDSKNLEKTMQLSTVITRTSAVVFAVGFGIAVANGASPAYADSPEDGVVGPLINFGPGPANGILGPLINFGPGPSDGVRRLINFGPGPANGILGPLINFGPGPANGILGRINFGPGPSDGVERHPGRGHRHGLPVGQGISR